MAEFLSLLVGKLLDYTVVPVGRQLGYLFCYNANWEEFRTQLSGLETLRNDVKLRVEADERNGKVIFESVNEWLAKVDAVSVESRRFDEEEEAISKRCFNGPLNLKVRHQRSRKAKKRASEFERIKKDGKFDPISAPAPPLPIVVAVNNDKEFHFESRSTIFNEIMKAIKDDEIGMIGLWGMGGIGKTTLVKRVAKYARDEGPFNEVAMAVVSQSPSVRAIQGQIADQLGLELKSESEIGRAGELLRRLLSSKKIMVILDDIWDSIELNDIGIPSGSQHKGCKIILTTRKRGVCEEMGTGKIFAINLLSENEALDLFLQRSGVNDRSSELGRLAEKLCEECGRLPISIVVVARGLANKPKGSWEDMLNRLRKSDSDRKVQASIELSYNNLYCEEERMIFLLCALFPEDYKIPVQVLFEYGLGLNLFERVDNLDEAAVRAHNLASRLKSQCLLLDEGEDESVKMHDVIRDAALVIASKGKHVFLVQSEPQCREWSKKTAISLWSNDVKKLPDTLECPQLQILMLRSRDSNLQLHDNFFAGMKTLVILDLSNMEFIRLPQSFASLENLQTLRFIGCELGDISAIGKLQNLVSLSLRYSKFKVLPKEVGQLSNMRFLDFSNCLRSEVITPGVIQNLSQLEVLLLPYHIGAKILPEFKYLSRLIIIDICIRDASMLPDDVPFQNLKKFQVSIIGKFHYGTMNIFSSSSQILELKKVSKDELSKSGIKMLMKKAHHMQLTDISGKSVALPSPLGEYVSLKELIVDSCVDINYILDMSGSEYEQDTPSLQLLHLIDLPSLKEIIIGKFSSLLFSKLEHLKLDRLPSLVRLWSFQAESDLTTMEVASCNKLEYVFDHVSGKGLSKLKELKVRNCRNLEAICLSKEQDDDIVFPQLSHLKLSELEKLASFSSKSTPGSILFGKKVNFPILKSMHLEGMKTVKRIWHNNVYTKCFGQLQKLHVLKCDQLVEVFPSHLEHGGAKDFSKLEELEVQKCKNLKSICQSNEQDEDIVFPRLSSLKLLELENLTSFGQKFTSESTLFGKKVKFLILKSMHVEGLKSVKTIWHVNVSTECFSQLQRLYVSKCDQLVEIFPSHLEHGGAKDFSKLEELEVHKCKNLKSICQSNEQDEDIIFPQLSSLKLLELENLTSFGQKFTSESTLFGKKVKFLILKSMHVEGLKSVKTIWHVNVSTECFSQLQRLYVSKCDQLVEIFPSHLEHGGAKDFSKLEELEVQKCKNLKSICQSNEQDEDIVFPQLSSLKLLELENLTSFDPKFTSESTLFGEKVNFPILENMHIEGLKSLKKIWHDNVSTECFSQLKELYISECDQLVEVFPCHLAPNLNCLEVVTIKQCCLVKGKSVLKIIATLPKLKNLELHLDHEPIELKDSLNRYGGFQSLTSLDFSHCNGLKSLSTSLTISVLAQLQDLFVSSCESMESIIGEENFDKSIEFSKLKNLTLDNLPHLASFYHGACDLKFPCLRYLSIKSCPKLKTLASMSREMPQPSCLNFVSEELFGQQVSFGRLRDLKLKRLELIEEIWHCDHATTAVGELRRFSVKGCDSLLKIFPSNLGEGLQNLRYLYIKSCRSLEHVFAVEHHPPLLSKLNYLELEDLPELKQLWWNKNSRQSFGLPRLNRLEINSCPTLEFIFDPSVGNCLKNLTALVVKNCSSMVEIVAEKPGKKVDFPLLYSLELVNLPCFKVKQDVEFPHAEFVSVDRCFNMKERCEVHVKHELAAPVRYFESFVELMKTELHPSASDPNEDENFVGDDEAEGVAESSGCDR